MNDRVLPHSLEAERAILGAILLHSDAIHRVVDVLKPDDFFRQAHRIVFQALIAGATDLVMLRDRLTRQGTFEEVGGAAYIAGLVDGMPRLVNLEQYAGIVRDHAARRRLIGSATDTMETSYDGQDPPADVIDRAVGTLLAIGQAVTPGQFVSADTAVKHHFHELEELSKPESRLRGVPTGYRSLDRLLIGFRPGTISLIAARVSVGKTSLMLNIARQAATRGQAVGVFTLEMKTQELITRLVCADASVESNKLLLQELTAEEWARVSVAQAAIADLPIYFDDDAHLTPLMLRAKARRLQRDRAVSLLAIDYVQLMQPPAGKKYQNREQEVAAISAGIKAVAQDLEVPVLVLSQLSRAPEARSDPRPILSDLRESGALEQDAHVVLLIFRPEMYPKRQGRFPKRKTAQVVQDAIEEGVAEIIVAKHRNGPTGSVKLVFRKEFSRFEPLHL